MTIQCSALLVGAVNRSSVKLSILTSVVLSNCYKFATCRFESASSIIVGLMEALINQSIIQSSNQSINFYKRVLIIHKILGFGMQSFRVTIKEISLLALIFHYR